MDDKLYSHFFFLSPELKTPAVMKLQEYLQLCSLNCPGTTNPPKFKKKKEKIDKTTIVAGDDSSSVFVPHHQLAPHLVFFCLFSLIL